jgi:hypothetical protein
MRLYYLTQLKDNNLHENSSSPRPTVNPCASFDLHLRKKLLPFSPGHQLVHNEVKGVSEYDLRQFTKC